MKRLPRRRKSDFEGRYIPATGHSIHPQDMDYVRRNIPCQWACPALTDVPGYIRAVHEGDYARAYVINRTANLFPGVLGRICSRPCEDACRHGESDLGEPVGICHLKRAAADNVPRDYPVKEDMFAQTGKSVGIVGGGPAGLAAAHLLALFGHRVRLYEEMPKLGGMLLYGIPDFRVSPDLVEEETYNIVRHGVQVELGTRLGRDVSIEELRSRHDAVVLAIGCYSRNTLGIPGEKLKGVFSGLDFMMEVNEGRPPAVGEFVAVIGGGFTAMDCARSALRLGARRVTLYIRKTEEDLKVTREEILETKREGVEFVGLVSTVKLLGKGSVSGVRFVRNRLSGVRGEGKKAVPIEGSEFEVRADTVIAAVGQKPAALQDWPGRGKAPKFNPENGSCNIAGLFLAGDFLGGASTVISAIGHAQKVAVECDRFLMGRTRRRMVVSSRPAGDTDRERAWDFIPRVEMPTLELPQRLEGLDREVETGYTPGQAEEEARRCYLCHLRYTIHIPDCIYCRYCIDVCPRECIHLVTEIPPPGDAEGLRMTKTSRWSDVAAIFIDSDRCIRCGECLRICPTRCIHVTKVTLANSLVMQDGDGNAG